MHMIHLRPSFTQPALSGLKGRHFQEPGAGFLELGLVAKPKAREEEKEREAVTRPFPRSTVLSGPSGLHWLSLTAWRRLCEIERTSGGVAENSARELSLFHPLGENEKTHFHHQLKG